MVPSSVKNEANFSADAWPGVSAVSKKPESQSFTGCGMGPSGQTVDESAIFSKVMEEGKTDCNCEKAYKHSFSIET
jgi:hypothetical protein